MKGQAVSQHLTLRWQKSGRLAGIKAPYWMKSGEMAAYPVMPRHRFGVKCWVTHSVMALAAIGGAM